MLAAAFLGLMLFLNAQIETLLDADMSSELILSKLLAQEKRIMTTSWYYSTELRVLNTQLIYAFFFNFLSDWHWVRMLSFGCMYLIMTAAYGLFCRETHSKKYFAITAVLLLLPFSWEYFKYVLYGAYYTPHITITFATMALMERYLARADKRTAALNVVLAVVAGMGGPRQIMILYIPLALTAAILWYQNRTSKQACKKFAGTLAVVLGACAGYVINMTILSKKYRFEQWDGIRFVGLDFVRLAQIFNGFLYSYGYRTGELFSQKAPVANATCALWLLLTAGMILYAIRNREKVSERCYRLAVFTGVSFGVYILLYLFTNMLLKNRYNLPIIALSIPLLAVFASEVQVEGIKKKWMVFSFVVLVSLNGVAVYHDGWKQDNTWELRKIGQSLEEQEYTAGYATFWQANVMTELSGGNIEMWSWGPIGTENIMWTWGTRGIENLEDIDQVDPWLQLVSHDTEHPQGKVFILLLADEVEVFPWSENLRDEHLIYSSDKYLVFGYESYGELRQETVDFVPKS